MVTVKGGAKGTGGYPSIRRGRITRPCPTCGSGAMQRCAFFRLDGDGRRYLIRYMKKLHPER